VFIIYTNVSLKRLMTMVYCASLDEVSTSNKAARKHQAKKIYGYINIMSYGTPEDPGNYKVPYDYLKTEKMLRSSLMIQEQKFLKSICRKFSKNFFMNEPNKTEWVWCQEKI
jgi:hypothetical protein